MLARRSFNTKGGSAAAVVTFVAKTNEVAGATTFTATKPTGTTTGDIMICIISRSTGASATSGWTQIADITTPTGSRFSVFYRVSTGAGDNMQFSVSQTSALCSISSYRGATTVQYGTATEYTGSTSWSIPSITPNAAGKFVCVAQQANSASAASFSVTTPAGATARVAYFNGSYNAGLFVSDVDLANVSSFTPAGTTGSSSVTGTAQALVLY